MDAANGTQHVKPNPGVKRIKSAQHRGHCIEPHREYLLLAKFIRQVEEATRFGLSRLNCTLGTNILRDRRITKTSSLYASHREY
jgi:hypothetical protein